jgi:hypothetical protein
MVVLVIINLIMMAIQFNFENETIRSVLKQYAYPFYEAYLPVYRNFVFIDGIFVAIFITEILIRWMIAIYHQTYHRWFFYPFVRWYEVLGCIPIGSFRILRIFRIVAIIIRLHRLKLIDIKQWYLYKVFMKYMNVLTEEISDRVVVNVIEGIQDEVKTGIPLTEKIVEEVIVPRKEVLVNFIAHRVQKVTRDQYSVNKEQLREYIKSSVVHAIRQNENIRLLEQLPLVGKAVSATIQQSVYDITFHTIDNIFEKMATEESRLVIEKITDGIIEAILIKEEDRQLQTTFIDIIVHSLDLIKEQVKIQQWKLKEQETLEKNKSHQWAQQLSLGR